MSKRIPDEEMIRSMYEESKTPTPVIEHMKAVADYQDELLDELEKAGICFDREMLRAAALLHDVRRTEKDHAKAGAKYVSEQGYPEVAALIEGHHNPDDSSRNTATPLTAEDILYYADKRLRGDRIVTVEERFAASAVKCKTPEAREHHSALLARAVKIEQIIRSEVPAPSHQQ